MHKLNLPMKKMCWANNMFGKKLKITKPNPNVIVLIKSQLFQALENEKGLRVFSKGGKRCKLLF